MNRFMNLSNGASIAAMMIVHAAADYSGFSLASFADNVTDDIKELDSLLMPAGVYAVRCTTAQLGENPPKEGIDESTGLPYPPLFFVQYKFEVLEFQPLDKSVDPEKYVGRTISDRITFWPAQLEDNIGLLKGKYKKIGLPNTGRMGGLEGGEPGWIDGIVEHMFTIRARHFTDKNKIERVGYDWAALPNQLEEDAQMESAA